jgi:hypothetical protein
MPFQEIDDQGNPVVNEAGEGNIISDPGSWDLVKSMIPEELQDEKLWENIQDTPTLLKNYAHAQKFQGQAVRIPGEDATPEDLAKFYSKLGRPEAADGYEVTLPDIKGGWDDGLVEDFKKVAHETGMTPKQVQDVLNFYGPSINAAIEGAERNHEQEQQAGIQALKDKYGAAYGQKVANANATLGKFGTEGLIESLEKAGFLNHPDFVEMLAGAYEGFREDVGITGHVEGIITPEAAMEEREKIMGDLKGPYWDENHPNHKETILKVQKLFQIIHPEPVKE